LGPRELSPDGVKEAFDILLAGLPLTWKEEGRIWVNAQKETPLIGEMVKEWMMSLPKLNLPRRLPLQDTPTREKITSVDYGLALWAPPSDLTKDIVNSALDKDIPFACLVPSCLVNLLPDTPEQKKKVEQTSKLVLLQPEVTWIIHGIPCIKHNVFSATTSTQSFSDISDFRGIIAPTQDWDFKTWVPEQKQMIKKYPKIYKDETIYKRTSDGFILYKPNEDQTLALVPQERVNELVKSQHRALCHGGMGKVISAIKRNWHWPTLNKDVKRIVQNCPACQLLKAKRARAHRHFRAKVFCTPRTSWGCDFYGMIKINNDYFQ